MDETSNEQNIGVTTKNDAEPKNKPVLTPESDSSQRPTGTNKLVEENGIEILAIRNRLSELAIDNESTPQTPIETASQQLIETLHNSPNYAGEDADLDGLIAAREQLELTFSHFPELIPVFTNLYSEELSKLGFDPGEIRIYMVGGRVRGTPLQEDSDIDIIFAFENPFNLNDKKNADGVNSDIWKAARKRFLFLLFNDYATLCQQFGIQNEGQHPGRFNFLGWGQDGFEEFQEKEKTNETLLLHSNKPIPSSPQQKPRRGGQGA